MAMEDGEIRSEFTRRGGNFADRERVRQSSKAEGITDIMNKILFVSLYSVGRVLVRVEVPNQKQIRNEIRNDDDIADSVLELAPIVSQEVMDQAKAVQQSGGDLDKVVPVVVMWNFGRNTFLRNSIGGKPLHQAPVSFDVLEVTTPEPEEFNLEVVDSFAEHSANGDGGDVPGDLWRLPQDCERWLVAMTAQNFRHMHNTLVQSRLFAVESFDPEVIQLESQNATVTLDQVDRLVTG